MRYFVIFFFLGLSLHCSAQYSFYYVQAKVEMKHGFKGEIWVPVQYGYGLPHQDSLRHTAHVLHTLSGEGRSTVIDHYSYLINYKDRAFQPGSELGELDVAEVKEIEVINTYQGNDMVSLFTDLVYAESPFWVDQEPEQQVSLAWQFCDWQVDVYQPEAGVEKVLTDIEELSRILSSVTDDLEARRYDLRGTELKALETQLEQLTGYGNIVEPLIMVLLDQLADKQVVIVQTCTD